MKNISLAISSLVIIICFSLFSCGKHFYVISGKEINSMAHDAREPQLGVFVAYENGDTLKGKVLKKKQNPFNTNTLWLLDGKKIPAKGIISYQDKNGYRPDFYWRLIKGKMELFMSQEDNSRVVSTYSSSTQTYGSQLKGGTSTSFYMRTGKEFEIPSLNYLRRVTTSCPTASEQVEKEFKNSFWEKYPSYSINDYRALVRIIKLYNACK